MGVEESGYQPHCGADRDGVVDLRRHFLARLAELEPVIFHVEAHRPHQISVVEPSEADVQGVGDAVDKCQAPRINKRGFRIEQVIGVLDGWAGQGQAGAFGNAGQGDSVGWILRSSPLGPLGPLPL